MIEEIKPNHRIPPEVFEIIQKVNEVIHQVNTLTLDMQMRYLKQEEEKCRHTNDM